MNDGSPLCIHKAWQILPTVTTFQVCTLKRLLPQNIISTCVVKLIKIQGIQEEKTKMGVVVRIKSWEISPTHFHQYSNTCFTQGPARQLIIRNAIHTTHKKNFTYQMLEIWSASLYSKRQQGCRDFLSDGLVYLSTQCVDTREQKAISCTNNCLK